MIKIEFSSGDLVSITTRSMGDIAIGDQFTVVRSYPVEHGEAVYRVRNVRDQRERMVPGSALRRLVAPRTDAFSAFGHFS
ncbi:hypothetical protein [Prosthecomicrobium pneumaticum]|uniref:Uncharacterized protein n=1 Tax=Prosthecomicrobium pneumaticum TaxID=81895 RepID=A0A7W9L2B3_9HYPH|nr:hypothetical protein [Prosthecomicrobium pneumaticum]MBB5753338.1 hypothetical protein [Prosthecomicrobium pneumaticum]